MHTANYIRWLALAVYVSLKAWCNSK